MVDDSVRSKVLAHLDRHVEASAGELARSIGITRQGLHRHLRALLAAGAVARSGQGPATRYRRSDGAIRSRYPLPDIGEDAIWVELSSRSPLSDLRGPARDVFHYALTELVNNAIDHSGAGEVEVGISREEGTLTVEVVDRGVGAFENVRKKLGLATELAALQEIEKGKTTTAPDRHSGEGLFFVSKAALRFRLESGGLAWLVDNARNDVGVAVVDPPREGTLARFEADPMTVRELSGIFADYTEGYEFARTRTTVKLYAIGTSFISRSEAKRLTHGLQRFSEVVLDFGGVEAVGQGFCDEVFRVWAGAHPGVRLVPVRMAEPIAMMVERARRAARS